MSLRSHERGENSQRRIARASERFPALAQAGGKQTLSNHPSPRRSRLTHYSVHYESPSVSPFHPDLSPLNSARYNIRS